METTQETGGREGVGCYIHTHTHTHTWMSSEASGVASTTIHAVDNSNTRDTSHRDSGGVPVAPRIVDGEDTLPWHPLLPLSNTEIERERQGKKRKRKSVCVCVCACDSFPAVPVAPSTEEGWDDYIWYRVRQKGNMCSETENSPKKEGEGDRLISLRTPHSVTVINILAS